MHLEKIKSLIDLLGESPLAEIELIEGDHAIRLTRRATAGSSSQARLPSPGQSAIAAKAATDTAGTTGTTDTTGTTGTTAITPIEATTNVVAPMFGIVHLRPAPDAAPFVQVGQYVEEGATLCTIEAMKTFNAVEAEVGGTIVEVIAVTGTDVEAGDILFRIAPRIAL